jgi:hypothetical protein
VSGKRRDANWRSQKFRDGVFVGIGIVLSAWFLMVWWDVAAKTLTLFLAILL